MLQDGQNPGMLRQAVFQINFAQLATPAGVPVAEAEEQSFDQKPTRAVNQLMEFMTWLGPPCCGLVPVTLRSVCASQHYLLAMRLKIGAIRNGDKALC